VVLEKVCSKCNRTLTINSFVKKHSSIDGFAHHCRDCNAEYKRQYALRDKVAPRTKECKSCLIVKTADEFYRSGSSKDGLCRVCKQCSKRISIEYQNSERGQARFVRWYAKYKESGSYIENSRKSDAKRRTIAAHVIKKRVKAIIAYSLKQGRTSPKWRELLPFDLRDLGPHLERQFVGGMNWDRFFSGEIHIDHIVPISDFNITSVDCPEFRACWSLANLRPIWANDNLRKSNKKLFLV
jgi:hypothetical protein